MIHLLYLLFVRIVRTFIYRFMIKYFYGIIICFSVIVLVVAFTIFGVKVKAKEFIVKEFTLLHCYNVKVKGS